MKNYNSIVTKFETILDFIRFGISEANTQPLFYGHGTDNSYDEICALILGSLSLPLDSSQDFFHARLTTDEKQFLAKQLAERIHARVPLAYLLKEAYFCDLSFYVDKRVLIPRSPIAELIRKQFVPWIDPDTVESILDLCTGSACIAIACKFAFPAASLTAVDISKEALQVAKINCERHGLEEELELICSDLWKEVPKKQFDIIVSNPPYVSDKEMKALPEEYLHEPELALRTGKAGLEIVEKILKHAHKYLADKGILIVEVGASEEALREAHPDLNFTWLDFENGGEGVFLLTKDTLVKYFEG